MKTRQKVYNLTENVPFENVQSQKKWNFHFFFFFPFIFHFRISLSAQTRTLILVEKWFSILARNTYIREITNELVHLSRLKELCVSMSYVRESVCTGRKEIYETGGGHVDELKISIPSLNGRRIVPVRIENLLILWRMLSKE